MVTGEIETHLADVVVLASGGYGNVFYLSTNAMGCNVTATWRAHRKGAYMANPCYTQIHPTCIPVSGEHQSKLTLMSESLRNDGRIWVPKNREDRDKDPRDIAEEDRDYYLERIYPSFGNLVPARHRLARREVPVRRREGRRPRSGWASTSTSPTRSSGWAARRSSRSTATSSTCTPASPARTPTRRRCGSTPRCTT